ncbi:infection structure specific protein [Podospora appendiculata]|uniref:Infection structure specific protein n=1 Tax=Podospora appendiculata TaxID=314037 RepID=A0AAE0X912_9PEZI|nr:infection structure specific protein [Podospora appendiculata]
MLTNHPKCSPTPSSSPPSAQPLTHALLYPAHQANELALLARQTDTGTSATACLSPLDSAYSSFPTAPPQVESLSITDAYTSAVSSWLTAHSSAISSALSQCPQYSSLASAASVLFTDVCSSSASGSVTSSESPSSTESGGSSMTESNSATATGTTSGGGSSATSSAGGASATGNAGPRETGYVAAVAAVAGFIGVGAAL